MLELDKNNEFVKAVFDYIEGGSIDNAVKILRKNEVENKLLITHIFFEPYIEIWDESFIDYNLIPFLNKIPLIIAGGDLLVTSQIYNLNFEICDFSWRAWGGILADWLNENEVIKPKIRELQIEQWQYIDFYMKEYLEDFIKNYGEWSKAILEIIEEKDKVFAHEYKANEIRTLGK